MDYVAGHTAPRNRNFYNTRTGEVVPAGASSAVGVIRKEGSKFRTVIFGQSRLNKVFRDQESAVIHILLLH